MASSIVFFEHRYVFMFKGGRCFCFSDGVQGEMNTVGVHKRQGLWTDLKDVVL